MAETVTLDEARLRAHELAMRTDIHYRGMHEHWKAQIEARNAERRQRRLDGPPQRLMAGSGRHEDLLLVRVWMLGRSHRRFTRAFSFEDEIRERILTEVRPGVAAMWSDPLEQLGLRRT